MKKPHKHAEVIKAWADGEAIQLCDNGRWFDVTGPSWSLSTEYRIKPQPKLDTILFGRIASDGKTSQFLNWRIPRDNLKLTFDGETGKLKSAEVLN
jgi:hypothetical protein